MIANRYMEAFSVGGEYQWQVVAQGTNGSDICVSEVANFNKSAYQQPQNNNGSNGDNGDSGNGGGDGGDGDCHPIYGCGGE